MWLSGNFISVRIAPTAERIAKMNIRQTQLATIELLWPDIAEIAV